LSFAIIFQVAKSALALVSARRAIIMSAALIKMGSAPSGGFQVWFDATSSHEPATSLEYALADSTMCFR